MDFETAFAKIKEWFEEENQKYLQMGQTAEQYLEYAFDFLEGTGLTGQEMVIFITELNSNARSVAFYRNVSQNGISVTIRNCFFLKNVRKF